MVVLNPCSSNDVFMEKDFKALYKQLQESDFNNIN